MQQKTIHYIWLGGKKKSSIIKKCIKSWQKYFPEWKIKEWNEANVNLDINSYCRQAYNAKKYAFASDVLRFDILNQYGGIYFDTDVEVLKSFEPLFFQCSAFAGFENEYVSPGLVLYSREPQNPFFIKMLDLYQTRNFVDSLGNYDLTTVGQQFTSILSSHGLISNNQQQTIDGFTIFPKEYFCPADYNGIRTNQTENTYSVHLFAASWLSTKDRFIMQMRKFAARILKQRKK